MDFIEMAIRIECEAKLLRHKGLHSEASLYEATAKNLRLMAR